MEEKTIIPAAPPFGELEPSPPTSMAGGNLPASESALFEADSPMHLSSFEREILISLRRILRAVSLSSRALLREHRLTSPQLALMRHLVRHGPKSAGDLARALSLSQATVTGILNRLEDRGLVERRRRAPDRRRVEVVLTHGGWEAANSVPQPLQERFARRLALLPVEHRERIHESLREVVELMEATQIEAAPVLAPGVNMAEPERPEPSE